ncbi:MAG: HAD-IIB family hydrolase [Micrococcales bacterium]|nr:HAD-IIB family hydrolase [Micrococcales bacterium]
MDRPRLLATDLDGTLLRPDLSVSPRTVTALTAAEAAGVQVVFVTARPHRWLTPLAGLVGPHGTAICANGASVVDVATLTVVEQHGMPADLVAALVAQLRSDLGPSARFATEAADGFAREHRFVSDHPVPPGSPCVDRIEDALPATTLKLLVLDPDCGPPEEFTTRVAAAVGDLATPSSSGADGLGEIAARGVTKARTLAAWAADRGIDAAAVWAVGDAPNDLPMLHWAGRSFAVANAHPSVRAVVDEVLPSNADDGVAALLERCAAG